MGNKQIVFLFTSIFISIMLGTYLLDLLAPATVQPNYGAYFRWRVKERMVDWMGPGSTVIFGDSTAHSGYKPDEINKHVYNFALDGSTPIEAYFFVKYMITHGKRPKNIILTYEGGHYSTALTNYWDLMLAFHSDVITRSDTKEILSVDKNSEMQIIPPYDKSTKGNIVQIPYYYDVAIGPLKQIKPNFTEFVNAITEAGNVQRAYFKSRGNGSQNNAPSSTQQILICTDKDKITPVKIDWKNTVILYYFEKLISLADDQKISVYIMGGPIAESCINAGFPTDWVKFTPLEKFTTIHFEYSQSIPVPDALMKNRDHVNSQGSSYFSQKVKPFFDAIE